jgi:UDP-N-acetylglucosamine 2-epimerase
MKIAAIVGARPQFIKLAPLSKLLKRKVYEVIIHTGQHYNDNMSEVFFRDLGIPEPDYNLGINTGKHGEQTGRMMCALEKIIIKENPSLVIIFGDTNTTLAGALVSAKLHIPIIHVEAGLRSFNKAMPEEINRIVTDHISDFLFAPTKTSVNNLYNEGLKENVILTGDIMVDALINNIKYAIDRSDILKDCDIQKNNYYLMTLHRPYNVDEPSTLSKILNKLSSLDKKIIFPVHPRTKNVIDENGIFVPANIIITTPVGYIDFLSLEYFSKKIITDSGGVQKEAYILKKPCITIRSETEWIETVEDGWNVLVDVYSDDFVNTIEKFNPSKEQSDIFGKNVAHKMFDEILEIINK